MSFQPGPDDGGDDLTLIAHRGFADVYPENTLTAMRGATGDGADLIEIDVQPCADGEVVVFHDPSLDSTTDREGIVVETTCETVLGAEVLGSGETVPTLEAAIDVVPSEVGMNIELKKSGKPESRGDYGANDRTARWLPLVERTLEVLADHDNPVLLSSFHAPALAAVREVDPTVPLAVLFTDAVERAFTIARRHDCVAIHPSILSTDRELVQRAHAEGLAVNPYTATEAKQAARLRRLDVDGVIADSAAVLDT